MQTEMRHINRVQSSMRTFANPTLRATAREGWGTQSGGGDIDD
jgi:hypothetical protein